MMLKHGEMEKRHNKYIPKHLVTSSFSLPKRMNSKKRNGDKKREGEDEKTKFG